jgi:poly-beta-1,6-N-acetyl-D-glucosamine synthase
VRRVRSGDNRGADTLVRSSPYLAFLPPVFLLVIVPFLNEERYIGTLLESIAAQTRPPDLVVLADDGSTDGSRAIVRDFVAKHHYARALRRPPRPLEHDRLATANELRTFQWALEQVDEPWDVVAKLDADLRLTRDLFATIERELEADERLGMVGPYLSVAEDGRLLRQRCPPDHVEGPTKFYRRSCYEKIAPLPPILGWDTIDEIRATMRGWKTASVEVPGGDSVHLRPMGHHDGLLRAYRRWGWCAYGYGEHPLHVVLVGLQRSRDRPIVIGGLSYIVGWAWAALRRVPRAEPELRAYVRRNQLRRICRRALGLPTRP